MNTSREMLNQYHRLLGYLKPYRWRLAAGIFFAVLYAPANTAILFVVKEVWSKAFESQHTLSWFKVGAVAALLPVTMLVRGLSDFMQTYLMNWVGIRVVNDLRLQLFAKLQTFSLEFFGEKRGGELISRTTGDVMHVQTAITVVVEDIIKQPITFCCVLGGLIYLNWKLTFVSLLLFPICLIPIVLFGRRVRRATKAALQDAASLTSVLLEAITGWRVIKVFCAEERELQDFRELCSRLIRERMRVIRARSMNEPIIVMVAGLGAVLACLYAYANKMPGSELVSFGLGLFMLYEPVKKISRVHLQIQESLSAAERVFEVLDREPPVREPDQPKILPSIRRGIGFNNVSFHYETDRVVLDNINLTVQAGTIVALVGASGSGKTTLLNLVPRFFDPTSGTVTIDEHDLREVSFRSLREQIGLVTQETFLFHDTVANNIGYGKPSANREEILSAARRAHAHEFITQMPAGYDTVIGESGMKLSGGQRQRLAIARAILKNPPILLLDEATSALDTESERAVQAALDELMWHGTEQGRHTMLVIAHRLSTVQHADHIVVLDKGQIVEQGGHNELLAQNGIYKRLYDLQFAT